MADTTKKEVKTARPKTTKEILEQQPKVRIKLPINPLNPEIKSKFVYFNELTFEIALGVEVDVPESIYKLLVETGNY